MIGLRAARVPTSCVLLLSGIVAHGAYAADADKGKVVFEKCAACHSLEPGKSDDAPTLAGIFGRKAGTLEDFRYSAAMRQSNITWNDRTLDAFIEDPQGFVPGNRMPFDGVKDPAERDDLLAYLKVATKAQSGQSLGKSPRVKWAVTDNFLVNGSTKPADKSRNRPQGS
jgi:cytochrome c